MAKARSGKIPDVRAVDNAYWDYKLTPSERSFFSSSPSSPSSKSIWRNISKRWKGRKFESDVENGWGKKSWNYSKPLSPSHYVARMGSDGKMHTTPVYPSHRNEFKMMIGEDGRPYTVPMGPMAGKFIAFENWVADDNKAQMFEEAFMREDVQLDEIQEDGGHIVRIQYNATAEMMLVEFRNGGSICVFTHVGKGVFAELKACEGKIDGSRKPPHNHLLGVRFWDIVRIRGTWHGSRYPFYYTKGAAQSDFTQRDMSGNPARFNGNRVYESKRYDTTEMQDALEKWKGSGISLADRQSILEAARKIESQQWNELQNEDEDMAAVSEVWFDLVDDLQECKNREEARKCVDVIKKFIQEEKETIGTDKITSTRYNANKNMDLMKDFRQRSRYDSSSKRDRDREEEEDR